MKDVGNSTQLMAATHAPLPYRRGTRTSSGIPEHATPSPVGRRAALLDAPPVRLLELELGGWSGQREGVLRVGIFLCKCQPTLDLG